MPAPYYIGIGFQRCATSWARACLSEHPGIGIRTNGIHYFSEHLSKGTEWYFQEMASLGNQPTLVDLSVSYGYPQHIGSFAAEMARVAPNAQVFAFVRNPVERAYSDYQRSLFRGELPNATGIEQAFTQCPEFIERGRYAALLGTLLQHIERDRLKIFFFEDVTKRPQAAWEEICQYFHADPAFRPEFLEQRTNHATRPKNAAVVASIRRVYSGLAKLPGASALLDRFRSRPSWHVLTSLLMQRRPEMPAAIAEHLRKIYEPDIAFLEELTGRNLSGWKC